MKRTGSLTAVVYLKWFISRVWILQTSEGCFTEHATRGPCRCLRDGRRKQLMHVSLISTSAFLLAAPALCTDKISLFSDYTETLNSRSAPK